MKRMATDKEPMSTAFHLALEEMAVVASWNDTTIQAFVFEGEQSMCHERSDSRASDKR